MSRFERDTIQRQIRQLGELLAQVLARARAEKSYESGLDAIREASATGFGPDRSLLDRLEPASAVLLLRDREAAETYAAVLAAEAELLAGLGRGEDAKRLERRAAAVTAALGH